MGINPATWCDICKEHLGAVSNRWIYFEVNSRNRLKFIPDRICQNCISKLVKEEQK